jgi:CHAT domain-containing protein
VGLLILGAPRLAGAAAAAAAPPPGLTTCVERYAASPPGYERALCLFRATQAEARWDAGRAQIERLLTLHPDDAWLRLVLGHVLLDQAPQAAERAYRQAADAFQSQGQAEGEVLAWTNLRNVLRRQGRATQAAHASERALAVAQGSANPQLVARGLILVAMDLSDAGRDLGRALRLLERAEALVFPDGSPGLQAQCLQAKAGAAARQGRLADAFEAQRRLTELAVRTGDTAGEAAARTTLAILAAKRMQLEPAPGARTQVVALAREALASAQRARSALQQASALALLADSLGTQPAEQREALRALERCRQLTRRGQPEARSACEWVHAERLAAQAPVAARAQATRALRLALEHGNPLYVASAWRARVRVARRTRALPEALADARQALDAIESLRALQEDASGSVELFADWSADYYWLAGHLLLAPAGGQPAREALVEAFAVNERLRARALLDALRAARVLAGASAQDQAQREVLARELSTAQRRLLEPGLSPRRRVEVLALLDELERRERALRPRAHLGPARFVTLPEVEAALAADEAMLVYQLGLDEDAYGEPAGGAWVYVVSRAGTHVLRLPARASLATGVSLVLGLLERRDAEHARASAALDARLLAPALAQLPTSVRRLIVIPDGALHGLPFAALQAPPDEAPRGARYEFSYAPSATLWQGWRQRQPAPERRALLALADPRPAGASAAPARFARERGAPSELAAQLGALPDALREGRAVRRLWGSRARLLVGARASEQALRQADLSGLAVLHLAAHALADDDSPEHSAVLLAAGDESQDGALQPEEIARLRLEGAVVVLSACRSAAGAVRPGEGVLSLARAFFEAGAHAVVAGLWPLRDDEAAWLVEQFYVNLANGARVSEALHLAQEAARRDGRPSAAWAGFVVLGDGATRPRPEGAERGPDLRVVPLLVALTGVVAAIAMLILLRHPPTPATRT